MSERKTNFWRECGFVRTIFWLLQRPWRKPVPRELSAHCSSAVFLLKLLLSKGKFTKMKLFFSSDIILDGLFGALAMLALWGVTNILSTLGCILLIKVPKNVDIWAWHDSALFSLNLTMSRWLTQNSKKWRKSVVDLQATSTSFMILLESSFC